MRKICTSLLFVIYLTSSVFGQDTTDERFLFIYLTLNGDSLYNGCTIKKSSFDSTNCLRLAFDTIPKYDSAYKYKFGQDFLILKFSRLDSIQTTDFSIKSFTLVPNCDGNLCEFYHIGSCFNEKDNSLFSIYQDYSKKHYIEDLKIYANHGLINVTISGPSICFKLKE